MVQNMTAPMGTDWRARPENVGVVLMPVTDLGPSWRVRPAPSPAVVAPPSSTGPAGWRPRRVNS